MKNICLTLLIFFASTADATLLEFSPADSNIELGDSVAIDIVANPDAGELIGEFAFDVNFDSAILDLDDVIFGPSLNDDPFFCTLVSCRGFSVSVGAVNLFEVSLVFPLTTLQDGNSSIVLATLIFDAIGIGASVLSFTGAIDGRTAPFNLLGDDFGVALPVFDPGNAVINVNEAQSVPEPGTLALLGIGLAGIGLIRRRPRV